MSDKQLNTFQIFIRRFLCSLIPISHSRKKLRKKWLRHCHTAKEQQNMPNKHILHFLFSHDDEGKINILLPAFNEIELKNASDIFSYIAEYAKETKKTIRIVCSAWQKENFLTTWKSLKKTLTNKWEFYCCDPDFLNNRSFSLEVGNKELFFTSSPALFNQIWKARLPGQIVYRLTSEQDIQKMFDDPSLYSSSIPKRKCILLTQSDNLPLFGNITFSPDISLLPISNTWNNELNAMLNDNI